MWPVCRRLFAAATGSNMNEALPQKGARLEFRTSRRPVSEPRFWTATLLGCRLERAAEFPASSSPVSKSEFPVWCVVRISAPEAHHKAGRPAAVAPPHTSLPDAGVVGLPVCFGLALRMPTRIRAGRFGCRVLPEASKQGQPRSLFGASDAESCRRRAMADSCRRRAARSNRAHCLALRMPTRIRAVTLSRSQGRVPAARLVRALLVFWHP